eukprot:SAG22_NODE_6441_length_855_cov_1.247354_1_plen_113_part_01
MFAQFADMVAGTSLDFESSSNRLDSFEQEPGSPINAGGDKSKQQFAAKSMGCLDLESGFRQSLISLVTKQMFDTVVLLAIGANSVMMALEDPLEDPDNLSEQAQTMENLDLVF